MFEWHICTVVCCQGEGATVDLNSNAHRIVSFLTDENKKGNKRSGNASKAGKVGGPARAISLSRERRVEIGAKAAAVRWGKKDGNSVVSP